MIYIFDVLIWIIIVASFIVSFVGLIYPIIPSVLMIWVGILLYQFGINADELTWLSWSLFIVLTCLLFAADYLANLHFVDKAGGSKWGTRAATLGLLVGSFIIPPFGVIIVPFVLVFLTEVLQRKSFKESMKVAFATLIAFLSGTLAKALIQLMMIVIFALAVIF